jgi:hypothetical protein
VVAERFVQTSSTVVVEDSREGWARALREIIALLYTGHVSGAWSAWLLALAMQGWLSQSDLLYTRHVSDA